MYNPSLHTATNKPIGLTGKPVDARSYYYDAIEFKYRPYISTNEVLEYLALTADRVGQFPIIINTGGVLLNGVITGGSNSEWWFKDGTDDEDLVSKGTPEALNFENGLSESSGTVKLGGELTENTTIEVTDKGLSIVGQDVDYLLTGSFKFDNGHGGVNPAIRLLLNGPLGSGGLTIIDGATTIGGMGEAINFNVNGTIFTSNGNQWAKYILDYSALGSLDDRSIPDLGYVKTLVPSRENTIDLMGDSMTSNRLYPDALQALLPPAHTLINMGISGNQAFNMNNRFGAVLNSGSKDVIIFGGVNDISSGRSAAEIQDSLQSMYTKARNAGKTQIIAFTIPPFGLSAIYTAPKEAVRVAVNTWISTTAIDVDKVIDVSTLLQDPSNNLNLDPDYDSGDGLHFNSAGGSAIAANVMENVTFTTDLTNTNLKISNDVSLQQGLGVFDSPHFRSVDADTISLCGTQTANTPAAAITAGAINNIALLINAALATQLEDLIQVQNAVGTPYFQVGPATGVGSFVQTISPQGTTVKGLLIKMFAAYATNPMEIQDSAGVFVWKVNQSGLTSTTGIANPTSNLNSQILLNATGAAVSNNQNNGDTALDVQKTQLAATGAIQTWRKSSTTIATLNATGLGIGIGAPTGSLQVTKPTNGIGTISTTALGTTVTGTNTDFLNRFRVGQTITANGETRTISAIASNISMTTDAWTNTNTNIAYTGVSANALLVNMNGNVSIASLNVNGGLVYTSGTTGLLAQSAAITGLVKGNGTSAPTAAVSNTDYLPVASPAMTGTPTAPTAVAATNTTQIATTAHVFAERTNTATLTNKTLTTPKLTGYTVATLPAGTVGMMAYVTDATAPTYLGTLTGGGAVVTPVFYNGTAWVSH